MLKVSDSLHLCDDTLRHVVPKGAEIVMFYVYKLLIAFSLSLVEMHLYAFIAI